MKEIKGTDWQRLLGETLAEKDAGALKEKAEQLEAALFFRSQELASSPDGHAELQQLQKAARQLLRVRVEKLGFPMDPESLRNLSGFGKPGQTE